MDVAAIAWVLFGLVCSLIGVIYWLLRRDIDRVAKNVHDLRSQVGPNSIWIEVIREKLGI